MDRGKKNIAVCLAFAFVLGGGFFASLWMPKAGYSYSERRKLAEKPQLTVRTLWEGRFMEGFEEYLQDTFPFREGFRRAKALAAKNVFFRQDNHGLYTVDGWITAVEYPMHEEALAYAASRFHYIFEEYLDQDNQVFLSVIPDKNCFLAEGSGHLSMDYAAFEKSMAEKVSFASYIPISDLLEREDYYKTDTHWRQERITDVAERLAQAMGAELSGKYQAHTLAQDFYGVYYGQAALPLAPDRLQYLTGASMEGCRVYDWQNGRGIGVCDMEKAAGADPYEIFLSGPLSYVSIENPKAPKDKKLVVFRDSFGSSLAPLLISGYSEIALVDIRYLHPAHLGRFLDFEGRDVLFLYSTSVLNNSNTMK